MGIRIHKAIGWGLTGEQFKENIGFEIEYDDLEETLYEKLNSITELVVPERSVKKIFEEWSGFITQPNLLAETFRFDEEPDKQVSSAHDLYQCVADYDRPTALHLFLPCAIYHRTWFRYDDTLDYIEATHDLRTGDFASDPAPFLCQELKRNPYVWDFAFMDPETGEQVANNGLHTPKHLVPQPPAELRWWLTETGILKPHAWKLLRPYYARWWQ